MNQMWHHGKFLTNDENFITVQASKNTSPITVDLRKFKDSFPETIEDALAYILGADNNLQRVSGYKTGKNKLYKYSFHSCVSMGFPSFYALKNEEEVIGLACYLKFLNGDLIDRPAKFLFVRSNKYIQESFLYMYRKELTETTIKRILVFIMIELKER